MDKLLASFSEHPASVGETYFQHMGVALTFGFTLLAAGFACLVHALFPFLFTTTARVTIQKLHQRIVTHRDRRSDQCGPRSSDQLEGRRLT
ncbi:MAG: DUF6356 family protein [Betaproteobacteria bacterium]